MDYAYTPLRLVGDGKNYLLDTYSSEYKKCGGDGYVAGGKAFITTGLCVTADGFAWISSFLGQKKDEGSDYASKKYGDASKFANEKSGAAMKFAEEKSEQAKQMAYQKKDEAKDVAGQAKDTASAKADEAKKTAKDKSGK